MIINFAATHIGQRKINEDKYFVDEELGLYIVADGVGGMSKGEVASQMTCQIIHENIKHGHSLSVAIEAAHQEILNEVKNNDHKKGMASTVVAVLLDGNAYEVAWVGDSRAYLWDGNLKQLTRDHSYVELLLQTGHISYEQMRTHPEKNVISQALGIDRKELSVATNCGTLEQDRIIFLATDGLYELTHEIEIIKQINQLNDIEELTESLVDYAVKVGGKDNITLLTIQSKVNTENKSDVVVANVVRSFDPITGQVIEVSHVENEEETLENISEEQKEVKVKSVTPRMLSDVEPMINDKVNLLESLMLILVIIAMLVIITLNL